MKINQARVKTEEMRWGPDNPFPDRTYCGRHRTPEPQPVRSFDTGQVPSETNQPPLFPGDMVISTPALICGVGLQVMNYKEVREGVEDMLSMWSEPKHSNFPYPISKVCESNMEEVRIAQKNQQRYLYQANFKRKGMGPIDDGSAGRIDLDAVMRTHLPPCTLHVACCI